jgi:predicted Fe-S protein YdhL (DUF1289 family)
MCPERGLCAGCLRTLDEIARWSIMRDEERTQVLAAVAERRALFGRISGAPSHAASVADGVQADKNCSPLGR